MKNFLLYTTFFLSSFINAVAQVPCPNNRYDGYCGTGDDEATAIVSDQSGNVYIAGTFINSIHLGNITLNTNDSLALFLAKINPYGDVLWAKEIMTRFSTSYNTILKLDSAGQLVMAGTCDNSHSDFATLTQPFTDGDIYVAKFNTNNGALLDFVSMGNHGYSWINDFTCDQSNIYVTGAFVGPVSFGPFSMTCTGTTNTFIAKFDNGNNAVWAKRVTNNLTSGNWGNKIGFDRVQHIYVTGAYGISCDFGNGNTLSSSNYSNGYLAKLDTAGNVAWARTSIPGETYFHQLVIDTASIIVVRESPATLVNYNQNGDTLWTKEFSDNSYNLFRQVVLFHGYLYALGSFNNSILFGDSTCSVPGNNIFIARFQLDGTFDWLRAIHTNNFTSPSSFDIDAGWNLHLVGLYQGPDTLDLTGVMPLSGGHEAFYVKLCLGAVAVNELQNEAGFSIYPVPFTDELNFASKYSNGELSIFDITGREVLKQKTGAGVTTISTHKLPAGLYVVHHRSGNQSFVKRVTKN